jgi:hypothetical protein
MRRFIAAILAAGVAVALAQDDPFLKGPELAAEIAKSCKDGCVTFSHEEAEVFKAEMDRLLGEARKRGFADGVQAQKAACRSLL